MTNALEGMTQAKWDAMPPAQRNAVRSDAGLTPQLKGYEGYRVEVVDNEGDAPRRFNVGKSTGWIPCHLEIYNARSHGGGPARNAYHSVRIIRKVR